MKITKFEQSCFKVEAGKILYFDPNGLQKGAAPADGLFVSHEHYDHCDDNSVNAVVTPNTEVVIPIPCKGKVKKGMIKAVKPGDSGVCAGFNYEVIPAYNQKQQFHAKAKQYCGYIVNIEGKRILHGGDTDNIPEFAALKGKIDIAMLPIGDVNQPPYTMNPQDAIHAIKIIQPKVFIPMHNWETDLDSFKVQCEKVVPNTKVEILKGRTLEI